MRMFFRQSIAGSSARQVSTLESKNAWISSTVIEPKSKKTLSLMINPGSKALPGGAASAGWGAERPTKPTATMKAAVNIAKSLRTRESPPM